VLYQFRLAYISLGQVRLDQRTIVDTGLGQVRLGSVRLGCVISV
jgi:hypothetical protein